MILSYPLFMGNKNFTWMVALLAVLAVVMPVSAEQCTTMSMHGFFPDTDCDGVHDAIDNCPTTANVPQLDSNRDGTGDACDLLIDEIHISPSVIVRANQFFDFQITLINNQGEPIEGVEITLENQDLDIDARTNVGVVPAGAAYTTEFLLKVPRCTAERNYPIRITTRYLADTVKVEQTTQEIKVVPGGECEEPVTPMENTIIETFYQHEMEVGESTIIPIKIINMNENAVEYAFRVNGLGDWGTYRIDPTPVLSLPAGHDTSRYLAIELEKWAPLGTNYIELSIMANGVEERVPIMLHLRETVTQGRQEQLKQALEVTLILIVFALIIAGFIIAYKKMNEEDKETHEILEDAGIEHAEGRQ